MEAASYTPDSFYSASRQERLMQRRTSKDPGTELCKHSRVNNISDAILDNLNYKYNTLHERKPRHRFCLNMNSQRCWGI
jgi:hypothetical protein